MTSLVATSVPSASDRGGSIAFGLLELSTTVTPLGFHTLGYVGAAIAMFALGFALRVVVYRWAAFGVLVLAAGRLASHELRYFPANQRIWTFLVAGVAMLAISFVYSARQRASRERL